MTLQNNFNYKTVIITGHTGFKGAWLTAWLKQLVTKIEENRNEQGFKVNWMTCFKGVWGTPKYTPAADTYTILIALPISLTDCHSTLSLIVQALELMSPLPQNIKFWIKPHPTVSPESIRDICGREWSALFEFVAGDFNECVERTNLLLGNWSSTCLETLAKGIPVIIVGNPNGLTHNTIPPVITEDIWRLSRTPEELVSAIDYYSNCSPSTTEYYRELGEKIRKEFFEQVTSKNIRSFLYE